MTVKTLTTADLKQFTGTEVWCRHPLVRGITYTEGAKYVAEHGGAYWLLDEIAFGQHSRAIKLEAFQVWKLRVRPDQSASLVCEDGNGRRISGKKISWTDFPLSEIVFYCTGGVILLPSEY